MDENPQLAREIKRLENRCSSAPETSSLKKRRRRDRSIPRQERVFGAAPTIATGRETMTFRVLLVCMGSICRSPTAEGVLKNNSKQWIGRRC